MTIGADGYLRAGGKTIRARYALADGSLDLNGAKVASDAPLGITLWRLDGPIRSLTQVRGLYANDTWSGPVVTYRRLDCSGGSVRVTVLGDASLFRGAQTVLTGHVAHLVEPGTPTSIDVPLHDCRARFAVSPTKSAPGDPRRLGIHFLSFEYLQLQ